MNWPMTMVDECSGIAPGNLARIFNPFCTTKPRGAVTGPGSPVRAGGMREHGGSIQALLRPGNGATSTFAIPIRDARAADSARKAD